MIIENEQAKFAVIPFDDYLGVKELLADEEKLADYLDYLHMQAVKKSTSQRLSMTEVKSALSEMTINFGQCEL